MNEAETAFHIVAEYYTAGTLNFIKDVRWPSGTDPKDTPACGYDNSKCPCRYYGNALDAHPQYVFHLSQYLLF